MKIIVYGGSGFIGQQLIAALQARGDEVSTSSLRGDIRAAAMAADGHDVIVNLAGESVAQRWSPKVKERIATSRTLAPRALIGALLPLAQKPRRYVSASAIGYYGTSLDATFTELSPAGDDFLGTVCSQWEAEAHQATQAGLAVSIVRTGLVLGRTGGALPKLLLPFKLGVGGIVGTGQQWYSWIHIDDIVGIYLLAIDGADGIFNATAPQPVRNCDFTTALATAVHRPAYMAVPSFALHAILGQGATVILDGQRALPERTVQVGYHFAFETIQSALEALLG